MFKRFLLCLPFIFVSATNSNAAEVSSDIEPFLYLDTVPRVLTLNGPIDFRTPLAFRRAMKAHPEINILVLNSPGGSVQAALLIAEEIYDQGLSTLILEQFECASACAYVFFSGRERLAEGKLGVHQISGGNDLEGAQLNLSDVFEALTKYGTPPEVITRMLRTPANDIYFFSHSEITSLGINRDGNTIKNRASNETSKNTQSVQENALSFVLALIELSSSASKKELLNISSNVYSDYVSFYGKSFSKRQLLEDKANYVDRWPIRKSSVRPGSISVDCNLSMCNVYGIYDWQVYSPKRNKRASGSAKFHYALDMSDVPKVIGEDGEVLSRR